MSPASRGLRSACVLVAVVGLSLTAESQGPKALTTDHYTVVTRDGAETDLAFARRWLDAAEELMSTKYHVVPDRYHISVNLLYRPENDIGATQSGQNRCCSTDDQGRKTGTIFLLGPSAPIWKERPLVSSLGLPKDGEDYHAKVLMSEYIPIGHYAAQDGRPVGGWQYYSAPQWFVQGLQEYDGIYHTTQTNRTRTADALMKWARQNEGRFACCSKGIELADPYNGGAALMAFLAAEFGEGIHERLLRSGSGTFDEALANETKPYSQSELLSRFRKWLADSK
jgi:hypothetical protein